MRQDGEKVHLGNRVYCESAEDGTKLILTQENDYGATLSLIVLPSLVLEAFLVFVREEDSSPPLTTFEEEDD